MLPPNHVQFMFNFKSSLTLHRLNRLRSPQKLHLHFGDGVFKYHLVRIYEGLGVFYLEVRPGHIGNFTSTRFPLTDLY